MAFDPNQMLSPSYSLANLTVTQQQLSQPNMPSDQSQVDNLTLLADELEELTNTIGGVSVLSAFRTTELQNALAAAGEPTASGTSFHELGRAVDITPTTMGITEYFGRILANDTLAQKFAEIAIKPSQNAIHLAINVPFDTRSPKVLGLNTSNVYTTLSADDIANYVAPYLDPSVNAMDYTEANLVTVDNTPLLLGAALLLAGAAYMMFGAKPRGSL